MQSLRQSRIEETLFNQLQPSYLLVEDESSQHHVPANAQTHFKVISVTEQFEGLTRVARHRCIHQAIALEFETGMHALSLHLYTPAEWEHFDTRLAQSPQCLGGIHHEN